MAQAITNTVTKNSYAGLFDPPKTTASALFTPSFNISNTTPQTTSYTATPLFPSAQTSTSVIKAPTTATKISSAPVAAPVTAPAPVANTAPVVGGANSGGTLNPNYNLQTASPAPAATTPARGLFPDVVSALTNYQNTQAEAAKKAQTIADEYGARIAETGSRGAGMRAGQLTTGTSPVAEGNAAVTAQTTAALQSALAAGETAALQGVQTGINANTAGANALNMAGNLAAPQVTAYGQTSFNPVTGQFDGGGSLPPEVMQQYATMAANGQYSAIPSFITSNPVLNAQLNTAAKAINPAYSPVASLGASSVLQGIPAMQSANTAAEGIKNTINTYLAANPTLNASDLAAGNILNQWIQGKQLTDPKYQVLFNYLNEYTNTLAPILGVGGDPTNLKTQIAASFINAAASGQSISQVLDAMSKLADNKIKDLQVGAIGGTTSVANTTPSVGGGSIWNF